MPDPYSPEDEAVLYVLNELTPSGRRDFEARLAQSAELRALVRDLEEGAVAVSLSSPQRRPSPKAWSRIEKAISHENRKKTDLVSLWVRCWRNGWAAAAACLVGWLLYAILTNRHVAPAAEKSNTLPREMAVADSRPSRAQDVATKPSLPVTNAEAQLFQAKAREIGELRAEIAALKKEMTQMSETLVQQRASLGESNRIKFYQLSPASTGGANADARLSPALQRAVFISIGRELGWLPDLTSGAETGGNHSTPVNFGGVDFVNFRTEHNANTTVNPAAIANGNANANPTVNPNPNAFANSTPAPQPQTESPPTDTPQPTIPAFVSGDNLILAVDPTVVPANSYLTFNVTGANYVTTGGSVAFGDNPMVVTIPLSAGWSSGGGFTVSVGSLTSSGISNLTQFFTVPNP